MNITKHTKLFFWFVKISNLSFCCNLSYFQEGVKVVYSDDISVFTHTETLVIVPDPDLSEAKVSTCGFRPTEGES
jgi:hypothetical protein